MNKKVEAYLQLSRISNLPTVWSNVLVGTAIASGTGAIDIRITLITILAISLFYVGGMAQNDLFDLAIDTEERPDRPLPSQTLTPNEVHLYITFCFTVGFALIAFTNREAILPTVFLLLCITAYNRRHKHWNASLIFMGLCRALIYYIAAAVVEPSLINKFTIPLTLFAVLLAIYIIALTLVAQKEAKGSLGYRRWLAWSIIAIPFIAHFFVTHDFTPALIISGIVLPLWLTRSAWYSWKTPPKVVPAILGWLAGICLVDAYFLALLNRPILVAIAGACFVVTVLGHRRILGT